MPFNTPHFKAYSYLGDECKLLERFLSLLEFGAPFFSREEAGST